MTTTSTITYGALDALVATARAAVEDAYDAAVDEPCDYAILCACLTLNRIRKELASVSVLVAEKDSSAHKLAGEHRG